MADFREVLAASCILLAGAGAGYYGGMALGEHEGSGRPSVSIPTLAGPSNPKPAVKVKVTDAGKQLKDQLVLQAHDKDDPLRDLAIGKAILAMDADMVQEVLAALPTAKDAEITGLQKELVTRWAHLDPQAAMAYAEKQPGTTLYDKKGFVYVVLKAWADSDPLASLDAAAKVRAKERYSWSNESSEAVKNMLDNIGGQDGAAAFDWARTHLSSGDYKSLAGDVCAYLAQIDPQRAAELALQLPQSQDYSAGRRPALDAVVGAWAAKDPAAAQAWAQTLGALDRPAAYQAIVSHWDHDDPKGAAEFYLKMPDWIRQRTWSGAAFTSWIMSDSKGASDWVKQLPDGPMKKKANEAYIQSLSQVDVKAAADLVLTMPTADIPYNATWQITQSLFEEDKNLAIDWLQKLPEGQARQNAGMSLYNRWATEDPQEAMEYILAHETGNTLNSSLSTVTSQWARNDPQGALEFLKGLPEGKSRTQAMNSFLSSWGNDDPKAAAALAATLPDAEKEGSMRGIARSWAGSDPSAAIAWAATLPEGKGKKNAYQSLAEGLTQYDSSKAVSWIDTLPQGVDRDAAVTSTLQRIFVDDPATSARLASTISDDKEREQNLKMVVNSWLGDDPNAAKSWVTNSNLPQEMKDKLINRK